MMLSRRGFVASVAGGAVATRVWAAAAPKEAGLASEGLLAGRPGFQPRTVMPLPHDELPGFLSRARLAAHHEEYVRDVDKLQAVEARLRDPRLGDAEYADARRAQVAAANAVLLHELYFGNLAPAKVELPRYVAGHLREHMGEQDAWVADFTRCALAAKRWAVLVYDPYDDRWHDVVMDDDAGGVWLGANPLVVCDVAEHAWATDHGSRAEYVAKFVERVDWNEVARRYKAVDRM